MPLNAAIQRIQRLMGFNGVLTDGAGGSAQTDLSNLVGPMGEATYKWGSVIRCVSAGRRPCHQLGARELEKPPSSPQGEVVQYASLK
eukprot:scaffold66932_cov57-Phaeocystis_antarctica.AAC.1